MKRDSIGGLASALLDPPMIPFIVLSWTLGKSGRSVPLILLVAKVALPKRCFSSHGGVCKGGACIANDCY
jgi:hypothetical protein